MGIATHGHFSVGLPTGEPTETGFGLTPDACCVQSNVAFLGINLALIHISEGMCALPGGFVEKEPK